VKGCKCGVFVSDLGALVNVTDKHNQSGFCARGDGVDKSVPMIASANKVRWGEKWWHKCRAKIGKCQSE
jgi:hypothetical protein